MTRLVLVGSTMRKLDEPAPARPFYQSRIFSHLADVFVLEGFRGRGLSTWMMEVGGMANKTPICIELIEDERAELGRRARALCAPHLRRRAPLSSDRTLQHTLGGGIKRRGRRCQGPCVSIDANRAPCRASSTTRKPRPPHRAEELESATAEPPVAALLPARAIFECVRVP